MSHGLPINEQSKRREADLNAYRGFVSGKAGSGPDNDRGWSNELSDSVFVSERSQHLRVRTRARLSTHWRVVNKVIHKILVYGNFPLWITL